MKMGELKSKKLSLETRKKIAAHPNVVRTVFKKGHKHSPETLKKISQSLKGRDIWNRGLKGYRAGINHHWFGRDVSGKNNPSYKEDRSTLAKKQERNDYAYQDWRKQVWLRDNFKCKIANPDCKGKIEAHHILSWRDYPELRYQLNNGITLCHAHHPRKRSEEAKLSPYFQSLVAEMN